MTDPLLYDRFHDPHLQTYFGNKNLRKHLRKVGLINGRNEIIPPKEYEATMKERSRQEHVRSLLSHGIVQRVMELEKSRQSNIRNELEAISKKVLVENVKESRQQYKQFHSKDFILFNQAKRNCSNQNRNPKYHQRVEIMKIIDEYKDVQSRLSTLHPPRSSARIIRHQSPKVIKSNVNIKDRCQIRMIYLGRQTNLAYNQSLFEGNGSEIVVMQQHCGGENLILFKNNLKPNEKFLFESHRHNEYPFALTLYVDGLIDCRISVCCEYKHKLNIPIGGKRSSFALLNVQGGQPCQKCRFNEHMAKTPLFTPKISDQNSMISDTTKSLRSEESNAHRLLRTPSPCDEHENDTNISNPNDEYREAEYMYLQFVEKLNDLVNWKEIGYLHSQLGNICKEGLGDYSKALEHYLMSLEIYCQNLSPLDIELRNIYLSIAHVLLLRGKNENDLSIEYFQRVLDIDNSLKNVNEINLINDHNYLGLLYRNENNFDKALFHFDKSLKYYLLINSKTNENFNSSSINETIYDQKAFKSLSTDKLPNLSEIHFNLATTYQNLGQIPNALKHAKKALQLTNFDQNKIHIYQNFLNKLQQI